MVSELFHGLHHGAETCDGTAAQIIPVAETAGHDDGVGVAQRRFLVPEQTRGVAEDVAQRVDGVLIAVGGGELEDGEVHL